MFGERIDFIEFFNGLGEGERSDSETRILGQAATLLASEGLGWEADWDFLAAGIGVLGSESDSSEYHAGVPRVISMAMVKGEVIKGICVDPSIRGKGVALETVSRILSWMSFKGRCHHFVFTTESAAPGISALGLRELSRARGAVLLEGGMPDFEDYLAEIRIKVAIRGSAPSKPTVVRLEDHDPEFETAAVVVNCNPMTLGHLHLITQASRRCAKVLVFVVTNDESSFPTRARMKIVERECTALGNVTVLPTGPYMVSPATFPSYFVRGGSKTFVETALDATLFAGLIAPAIGIRARFAGQEPFCQTTGTYNAAMAEILPAAGVAFVEIPRITEGIHDAGYGQGVAISASRVREVLRSGGGLEDLAGLVPRSTLDFLATREGAEVTARIRASRGRH